MGKHTAPKKRRSKPSRLRKAVQGFSYAATAAVIATVLVVGHNQPVQPTSANKAAGAGVAEKPETKASPTEQVTENNDQATVDKAVQKVEKVQKAPKPEPPVPLVPADYRKVTEESQATPTFRVASFNVLGYNHTAPGGNKPGWADGKVRIRWALQLLNAQKVSVAGLQEFQSPQYSTFMSASNNSWGAYPGMQLGRGPVQNSIVWRKSTWRFIKGDTLPIPYFHGKRFPMPHILLEHIDSGRRIWFSNYHNPANARGPAQKWRNIATSMEANLAKRLLAEEKQSVITTGDMNDRTPFVCPFTRIADPMHSADGAHSVRGDCRVSRSPNIDWVLGSAAANFSNFTELRGGLVSRTTDHPLIAATVTLDPEVNLNKCAETARGDKVCEPNDP